MNSYRLFNLIGGGSAGKRSVSLPNIAVIKLCQPRPVESFKIITSTTTRQAEEQIPPLNSLEFQPKSVNRDQ
ncbi:unnamed protein product [Acanthoscelides obtectus]|uniref:Uncharacterized protein n=1 Tax=Acanthoscelides obtectus TaxID=200917 RepID=A0A9P0M9C4_ACAOB|nr:unnamed protein product [Acanthoscelides obtectus]CAK1675324.1 hypothetical protein AOBTE_LOCUS30137 [Acanthoscelides obtectus]